MEGRGSFLADSPEVAGPPPVLGGLQSFLGGSPWPVGPPWCTGATWFPCCFSLARKATSAHRVMALLLALRIRQVLCWHTGRRMASSLVLPAWRAATGAQGLHSPFLLLPAGRASLHTGRLCSFLAAFLWPAGPLWHTAGTPRLPCCFSQPIEPPFLVFLILLDS